MVHTPSVHAVDVPRDVILRWLPGEFADSHDVYQPSALDPGQTYYWKVNEINETEAITSWQGNVWEFSMAE